jgi:CAAX prenyl protease-like protein
MLLGSFYPSFEGLASIEDAWAYWTVLVIQLVVVTGLLVYFRKTYLRSLSLRVSPWAFIVGFVGIFVWIFLAGLGVERWVFEQLGRSESGTRPSFNPWVFQNPANQIMFLVTRFSVLVGLVPIIEELLIRGWLVKWVEDPNFGMTSEADGDVSLKTLGLSALLSASIYGVLTHPGEALAAFVWFGMVTLLAKKTGNVLDCIVAHAVTNLLLGVYILRFQQWHLW